MTIIHPKFLVSSLLSAALLVTVALTSGCFAVLVGTGAGAGVAYVRGDLDVTLDAGFAASVRAGEKTLAELQYAKISAKQDALQATLVSRSSSDQRIELYFEKVTEQSTKLKIRVGTFGKESLQNEILTRLKSHL